MNHAALCDHRFLVWQDVLIRNTCIVFMLLEDVRDGREPLIVSTVVVRPSLRV